MNTRLTMKNVYSGIPYSLCEEDDMKAVNKLGQLEDIEDELGIDLITLFKALKNGIWSNHYAYLGKEVHFVEVDLFKGKTEWYISGGFGEGHSFKDYGNTWALTKEELEKC